MSDPELSALRRAHEAQPSDRLAKERLQDAWIRAGLGWHGETLPSAMINAGGSWYVTLLERNVYEAVLMPTDSIGAVSGAHDALVRIPLVYVSGGEVACTTCIRGHHSTFKGYKRCEVCDGAERVKITPFYVGRFPVTWGEYVAFAGAMDLPLPEHLPGTSNDIDRHPIINVTHADALAFCAWAGLRLPAAREWRWAAFGPHSGPEACPDYGTGQFHGTICPQCVGRPCVGAKQYPWGNGLPTPERCAAADPRYAPSRSPDRPSTNGMFVTYEERRGSTAPVAEWLCPSLTSGGFVKPKPGNCVAASLEFPATKHTSRCRLAPARPVGASWCGMHDAVGNVGHLTGDGSVVGGSFRTADQSLVRDAWFSRGAPSDDVGFRVAMSAPT